MGKTTGIEAVSAVARRARRRRGRRPPRVRVVPAPNQRRHDPPHAHVVLQGVERAIAGATPDPVGVAEEPRRADEGG